MRLCLAIAVCAACQPPGWGKPPPPDAGELDGTPAIDAATDGAAATCDHPFRLDGHATAGSVWLTGDFVMWGGNPQAGAVPFALGGDGGWMGSYRFTAGPHQYKFIVDGNQWIVDPTNPEQVDDGFGGKNSLYTCVP